MTLHLARFETIALDELDATVQLLTRTDRKYIVDELTLAALLDTLTADVRVLDPGHGVWSGYRSTYYDTPDLVTFRLAARKRPQRFKVRTRTYVDSGKVVAEVKEKSPRGQTVKHRRFVDDASGVPLDEQVRSFASAFDASASSAHRLMPVLVNWYRRATLVLPGEHARVTIDADFQAAAGGSTTVDLAGAYVIETKTAGRPSSLDRALWRAGVRPLRFSKYATALAAMRTDLPANRWHRTRQRHVRVVADPAPNRTNDRAKEAVQCR